jgi:nitroreductase
MANAAKSFTALWMARLRPCFLILASINEGLGAAFVGAFDDAAVRAVLNLPEAVRPIGIIPIGHCAERGERLPRLPRERVIHYEE